MAATFDLVRKVNQTLSGGNLIATSTGAGGVGTNRTILQPSYGEFTLTTLTGVPRVGISTLNAPQTTTLENGNYCLGYDPTGAVKMNNVTLATIATWVQGNRIDVAVHPTMKLIWFRVAGGNWNNDVIANQDPATNTGGIDFSGMTTPGTFQMAISTSLTGNVWSAVFSAAGWAGTAPAGYGSLDATPIVKSDNLDKWNPNQTLVAHDSPLTTGIFNRADIRDTRNHKFFMPAGVITKVSGTVKENGVVVAGRKVEVYDRLTGELLGTTTSAADGTWNIACLGRPAVRVVGSDPTTYNSLVFDNVVPA
jgi:hypothetical protein